MKQFFDQVLDLLKQGLSAIFRIVEMVWIWSSDQILQMQQAPWQSWPAWKQVALVIVAIAVVLVLLKTAQEFWKAGEGMLAAIATLFLVVVRTVPLLLLAGAIAAGGLWLINKTESSGLISKQAFVTPPTFQQQTPNS